MAGDKPRGAGGQRGASERADAALLPFSQGCGHVGRISIYFFSLWFSLSGHCKAPFVQHLALHTWQSILFKNACFPLSNEFRVNWVTQESVSQRTSSES